ncbi:MAG: hypothetical protein DYG89_43945 [Caldilinea sp. CFX5]|nr:hypothetical protein [Caldilinea sp. CFX5]
MRVRRLQRKFEENKWVDDAYAYEDQQGFIAFRYNLTWGRMGSSYNQKIKKTGVTLEKIDAVIPSGQGLRWLPIEVIKDDEVVAYLAALDENCMIPQTRTVSIGLAA